MISSSSKDSKHSPGIVSIVDLLSIIYHLNNIVDLLS